MKKTPANKLRKTAEMPVEYKLDYKKAKPNRFASPLKDGPLMVAIDPDVARVFTSAKEVNKALRAIIAAMPKPKTRTARSSSS